MSLINLPPELLLKIMNQPSLCLNGMFNLISSCKYMFDVAISIGIYERIEKANKSIKLEFKHGMLTNRLKIKHTIYLHYKIFPNEDYVIRNRNIIYVDDIQDIEDMLCYLQEEDSMFLIQKEKHGKTRFETYFTEITEYKNKVFFGSSPSKFTIIYPFDVIRNILLNIYQIMSSHKFLYKTYVYLNNDRYFCIS